MPKSRRDSGRPVIAGGYRAEATHQCAQACTVTPRVERRLRPGTVLCEHVLRHLQAGCSPEQIACTLAFAHSETPSLQNSHDTICTAIYAMPSGALRTAVIDWLRFGHAKRLPRASGENRGGTDSGHGQHP